MSLVSSLVLAAVVAVTGSVAGVARVTADQLGQEFEVQRCGSAASHIAEFGGAYLEERAGDNVTVLYVWMTDGDAAATEAVLAVLREQCPAYGDVVIREAAYSYAELSQWQSLARDMSPGP